jgi:hypothetical protein
MLITLRKAVNLRNDIEKFVVTNKIQSSVTVSVYATNIVECLEDYVSSQRKNVFLVEIENMKKLLGILSDLRMKISNANHEHKIDNVIAEMASIDRFINFWKNFSDKERDGALRRKSSVDLTSVKGQIASILRSLEKENYLGSVGTDVSISLISPDFDEEVKNVLSDLKRQKETLNDQRIHLNALMKIDISDEDVVFLQKKHIL